MVAALVVPWVVFCAPVLVGKVFLDGDNFIQNFPLRVLVGESLRHGVLPLMDPYLFSGAPLLGGFNAGAAYPATWLFGILPSQTAWSLNLAFVYDTTLAGTYLFLRRQPVSSTAATLGAVTFAFLGFMSGQIVHIDIIEGSSWLPWMLLSLHALTTPPPPSRPAGVRRRHLRWWAGLLAVSCGLSMLAGGPEAFLDGGVLAGIYLVYRMLDQRMLARSSWWWSLPALLALGLGAIGSVALASAQLVPGLAFLSQSQRSAATYTFFTSGSLPVPTLSLLTSPFALGTNQSSAPYAGGYNFPEVISYVGILALVGFCALPAARWRRRPETRRWAIWYLVMAVGLFSALGSGTPFGHVLYLIPGIRSQRLLNRNLLLVDFSMAVLAAWFVHLLLASRTAGADGAGADPTAPAGTPGPAGHRTPVETVLTCVPVTLSAVVCVLLWATPAGWVHFLGGVTSLTPSALRVLAVVATVELVIAAAGTAVVLTAGRWSPATLRRLLSVVLVVDVLVFTGLVLHPPTTRTAAHARGALARQFSSLIGDGRFIIYDPDIFEDNQLYQLGQTDLNVTRHQPSAQGYAALVDNGYYDATGSHYQEDLDPQTLAGPVWDQLNTRVLLSLPSYFVTRAPGAEGPTADSFPTPTTDPELAPPGPTVVDAGAAHRWYLGGVLTADRGTVPRISGDPAGARVGVVTPAGATDWLPASSVTTAADGTTTFSLGAPTRMAGIAVQNRGTAAVRFGAPTLATREDGAVVLDGRLQGNVSSPHWVYTGTIGSFGVFHNTRAQGWARVEGERGGTAPAGTVVQTGAPDLQGGQRVVVHATGPVRLVRSVSWTTGWHASAQPIDPATGRPTGPAVVLSVHQDDAVQRVQLPAAGSYVVTFSYRTLSAVVGIAISLVTGVGLVAWTVAEAVGIRRRRRAARVSRG